MKREKIMSAIYRYGDEITVCSGGGEPIKTRGFFEPLLYKNKMYVRGTEMPFGYSEGGRYLLICPRVADLSVKGTVVEHMGEKYFIQRADDVYLEDEILYTRSILAPFVPPKEDAYEK